WKKQIQECKDSYQIGGYETNFRALKFNLLDELDPDFERVSVMAKMDEHAFEQIIPFVFEKELASINDRNLNDQMYTCTQLYLHVLNNMYSPFKHREETHNQLNDKLKNQARARLYAWLEMWRSGVLGTDEEYNALGLEDSKAFSDTTILRHLANLWMNGIISKEDYQAAKEIIEQTMSEFHKKRREG
ncbi:hypothetical protein KY325_04075, partial [Candidatus Woesearchaeota archaeon]|nr:hypothetical protein [Candidatus Woesearchaeota archaeon]